MKKSMVVTIVTVFLVFMAGSYGFAQVTGVADTTKEGSLLIWPLIETHGDNDTYIMIANTGGIHSDPTTSDNKTHIKCYWEVKEYRDNTMSTCYLSDFIISLSLYASVIFKASNGESLDGRGITAGIGDDVTGTLKCFAIDEADTAQISWNHLSGYALIVNRQTDVTALQYPAWRFAANLVLGATQFADNYSVGLLATDPNDPALSYNELRLAGCNQVRKDNLCISGEFPFTFGGGQTCCVRQVKKKCKIPVGAGYCVGPPKAVYDACPNYLIFDFLAESSSPTVADGYAANFLALTPCKENLSNGVTYDYLTRLSYDIWDENEGKHTGVYQCSNCNYDRYLRDISTSAGLNYFKVDKLHTSSGRFRVKGLTSQYGPCTYKDSEGVTHQAVATPLIGIMTSTIIGGSIAGVDQVSTNPTNGPPAFATSTNPALDGYEPGYIRWTPAQNY